jgi:uncharacterized protein
MLRVSLAEARAVAVDTTGELAPDDPALAGIEWPVVRPVQVRGRFSTAGEGKFFWRGHLTTAVQAQCRRCLSDVDVPLAVELSLIFSSDADTPEGEGCYPIPPRSQDLDLTDAVREELLLAMPQFVECRPDCRGLCPRCGANLNEGPCSCPPERDPRWDALRQLSRTDTKQT